MIPLVQNQEGRAFYNMSDLIDVARATGLEVEVVTKIGKRTFKQQVELMSGTGILIAAHGATLVNSVFLPQHAVVMEVFPFHMRKTTYYHLANVMGLFYLPVYARSLPPYDEQTKGNWGMDLITELKFEEKCLIANQTTMDALLQHACNQVSKLLPMAIETSVYEQAIRDAVDLIGAYSARNLEWQQIRAKALGSPQPTPAPKQNTGK